MMKGYEIYDQRDRSEKYDTRSLYAKRCACGQLIELRSQHNNNPEYYTTVAVICSQCRDQVVFELPVN